MLLNGLIVLIAMTSANLGEILLTKSYFSINHDNGPRNTIARSQDCHPVPANNFFEDGCSCTGPASLRGTQKSQWKLWHAGPVTRRREDAEEGDLRLNSPSVNFAT